MYGISMAVIRCCCLLLSVAFVKWYLDARSLCLGVIVDAAAILQA